ncbi:MAG: hypothetical protein PHE53_02890 [Thermoguttaceae bacterium]|nr:hypothetical protein [Thermoguttaceae bacterium]
MNSTVAKRVWKKGGDHSELSVLVIDKVKWMGSGKVYWQPFPTNGYGLAVPKPISSDSRRWALTWREPFGQVSNQTNYTKRMFRAG